MPTTIEKNLKNCSEQEFRQVTISQNVFIQVILRYKTCAFHVRSVYRGKHDTFFFSGDGAWGRHLQVYVDRYTKTQIQALYFSCNHFHSQSPPGKKKKKKVGQLIFSTQFLTPSCQFSNYYRRVKISSLLLILFLRPFL